MKIVKNSNEEYPIEGGAANREMLIKGAPFVFCELVKMQNFTSKTSKKYDFERKFTKFCSIIRFVEDRHDNQKVLGGFVDEAMAGIRTFLEGKITEQQVQILMKKPF